MALAYLSFKGYDMETATFKADIGTNKFYRYKAGESRRKVNGLEMVDEVSFTSPYYEYGDVNPFNSSFELKVPANLFSGKIRFIQLYSFKDRKGKSPALSKVIQVYPDLKLISEDLPDIASTMEHSFMNENLYLHNPSKKCRHVSFSFEESTLSKSMFLDALLDAAKVLAPIAVKAIAGLIANEKKKEASPGQTTSAGDDKLLEIINTIVGALKQQQEAGTPTNGTAAKASPPIPEAVKAPAVTPPALTSSLSYTQGISYKKLNKLGSNYSQAKIIDGGVITIPMLAALLGPLLEKAPELLQVVTDSPVKLLNVINQASLQKRLQEQNFISNLIADTNRNTQLMQLLRNNYLAQQQPTTMSVAYKASDKLSLQIEKESPLSVNGKPKFIYSAKGPIKLVAHLAADSNPGKPIPKALVTAIIKDSLTLKVLFEKKFQLKEVYINSFLELEFTTAEIQSLPLNKDLLVSLDFIYPTKDKKNIGVSDTHLIYLADNYILQKVGDQQGASVPLKDMTKYRVFWNKIWEGSAGTKRRWEIAFDTKYYVYYRPDLDTNGRVETKIQAVNPADAEEGYDGKLSFEGKLKSGIELSAEELNKILTDIGPYEPLSQDQLKALKTDEVGKLINQEAKARIEMRGRDEEMGAVWTFPEVSIHEIMLGKITQTGSNGQVAKVEEEKVFFPRPSTIHFVGVKTEEV